MEQEKTFPLEGTVTIFPNIFKTREPYHISLRKVFDRIRRGKSKELVEKIRNCEDKKERHELKKSLPSI